MPAVRKVVPMNSLRITTACVPLLIASCSSSPGTEVLPKVSEIKSMRVTQYYTSNESNITFDVPHDHLESILTALKPAEYDPSPAKWKSIADLHVDKSDGTKFVIALYSIRNPPGAFSAGPTHESRVYYRGGDSRALEAALDAAYSASKQK